ncbi:DUF126 domain-containing protein [Candidatus Bathyarchaeota archaeon]|nr:DUF126 domain-containing protein [Candidatus Bathyarchaeota archaeon]
MAGRIIHPGNCKGPILYTEVPLLIYGGIDVSTGIILEEGHPLQGECIQDKILVFPRAKGSTVGSYTLLQVKANHQAPMAIINEHCEPIIATGVIMARIPCIDEIDIKRLKHANQLEIKEGNIMYC